MSEAPPPYGPPPGQPPYGPPPGYPPYRPGHPPPGYPYYPPPPRAPYEIGAAISWAWLKFQAHWKVFVVGMLPAAIIGIAFYALYLASLIPVWLDSIHGRTTTDSDGLDLFKRIGILYLAVFLLAIPLSVVHANLVRAALLVADGSTPTLRTLISTRRAGRIMVTYLALSLVTLAGTILCYVPGLAFAVFSFFTIPFLVDQDKPMLASVQASFAIVRANFWLVALTVLVVGLIAGAGSMVCVVGIVVALPLVILMNVYAYRALTGGAIAP